MFLIYYDEVKYDPPNQESHWFGGIAVHVSHAGDLELKLNDISEDIFGNRLLAKETEFHGKDIIHGKGNFRGKELEYRIAVFNKLLDIVASPQVFHIYAKLNVSKLRFGCNVPEFAFMLFVEKVEEFLKRDKEVGMLFGDFDQPMIGPSVANLSEFRSKGTRYSLGTSIDSLLDTVYFAHSHHSRLIQLADIYLYSEQFKRGSQSSPWRKAFRDVINSKPNLYAKKYKDYPRY